MPYLVTEKRTVQYHSDEWKELAEQGWFTWTVDSSGEAAMIRQRPQTYEERLADQQNAALIARIKDEMKEGNPR